MNVDEAMHQRWSELTDNGKNDSSVSDIETLFQNLHDTLRARFNPPRALLAELEEARAKFVAAEKRNIVGRAYLSFRLGEA